MTDLASIVAALVVALQATLGPYRHWGAAIE